MPFYAGKTSRYRSWGRYPKVHNTQVELVRWAQELPDLSQFDRPVLGFGYGRSYGDSCLNNDGVLLDTTPLKRFIAFDTENGLLTCEAGVSLADILKVIVPRGWFLPVTPGTKFVSMAGAIANDIHGKNHHMAGTFGSHVQRFELMRSDGMVYECAPDRNVDLFNATIGGLGLTGLILQATFKLKKIESPFVTMERIRFESLDEFWQLNEQSNHDFEYTVSWLDCLSSGHGMGRGHFFRGNHATRAEAGDRTAREKRKLRVPFDMPAFLLNGLTMRAFTEAVYRSQLPKVVRGLQHYDPFFYPLDSFLDWNRAYGSPGFLQYQLVIPFEDTNAALKDILAYLRKSGQASFLTVFKTFGDVESPGMLSFPRPGVTLALDFPMRGERTFAMMARLDEMVIGCGGALYPAKDARMSPEHFRASFPRWQEFSQYIDPKFSSSFWRRVTQDC